MTQISLSGVAVEFGATPLLENVTFTVAAGERWGIIGRNGTGKTTLLKLITGAMAPTRGAIARQPGLRIALLEQHRDFGDATTVWEAAAGQFAELLALERSLAEQATRLGELGDRATERDLDRYARDLERFDHEGGYTFAPRVDAVLHGLGFDPVEARTRTLDRLSGGERGRVGLARQLVAPADVLLLDEPTNHLDLETTAWLEQFLRDSRETIILISHDRAFLERVVNHVLHVEAGTAIPYTGGYTAFVQQRAERRLTQQRAFDQQRKMIAKEEDYIRRNIAGQNSRQAKGRRTRLERLPRLSAPSGEEDTMALRLEAAERGGDQVISAEHVRLALGERVLLRDFTATVQRGDVLGFIGPNGAGKSTLLRAIAGERDIDGGALRIGASVTVAHYRQDLGQVPTDRSLFDIINDLRPMWGRGAVLGHLARFGFTGDAVQRSATTLSGGERARMALAMIMLSKANLLLLDEPTNHLDVESIEALEDAIEGYGGTVLLVSHDRALLRALATRTWVLHDARITDFDGSFAEWEEASAERSRAAAIAAAEEEESRRVRERQQVRRNGDARRGEEESRRAAKRELAAAEAEVERREARVRELGTQLEDPDLYTTPEGSKRAHALAAELEGAKRALEEAFARWEAMVSAAEGAGS
ncbi:MAG TPA: ABC-F family ATP-binding cassette domain-containing protein [Gemmatimonadaceae bacterium]|nr:ABC-F family ATP-binding cassette domain-containing protein [Gemmatimonadaceae bacterium]